MMFAAAHRRNESWSKTFFTQIRDIAVESASGICLGASVVKDEKVNSGECMIVHLETHLRFSYCSLHEVAGTAVKT